LGSRDLYFGARDPNRLPLLLAWILPPTHSVAGTMVGPEMGEATYSQVGRVTVGESERPTASAVALASLARHDHGREQERPNMSIRRMRRKDARR
jgi:hypothetical protein